MPRIWCDKCENVRADNGLECERCERRAAEHEADQCDAADVLKIDYESWRITYEATHGALTPDQRDAAHTLIEYLVNCAATRGEKEK